MNGEKRLAWETVEKFGKWLRWNEDRTHAYVEAGAPTLSDRILGAVRRSGGWSVYLRITDEDFPFVQKRFFDEYEAAPAIERVAADPSRQLVKREVKQLSELRSMEQPKPGRQPTVQVPPEMSPQRARIMKAIEKSQSGR